MGLSEAAEVLPVWVEFGLPNPPVGRPVREGENVEFVAVVVTGLDEVVIIEEDVEAKPELAPDDELVVDDMARG